MSAQSIASHLNKMEKLEIYNIGSSDWEVWRVSKSNKWRGDNIRRLMQNGVILETDNPHKAYALTPLGEEVYKLIMFDAQLTIIDFRTRSGGR